MSEKIVIGDRVIEMEIWRVGPGYTDEERERMRRPDVRVECGVRSAECGADELLYADMVAERLACGL